MVNRTFFFAWLFSLKYDCKRSHGVNHTNLILFTIWIHNYNYSFLAITSIVMPSFGGYYRNPAGIIGSFKCAIKACIHSDR